MVNMYASCLCECDLPMCVSRMCVRVSETMCMLLVHSVIYVHIIALFSAFVTNFRMFICIYTYLIICFSDTVK